MCAWCMRVRVLGTNSNCFAVERSLNSAYKLQSVVIAGNGTVCVRGFNVGSHNLGQSLVQS